MWAGLQNAGAAKTAQIWGRGRKAQSSHENRTIKLVTHTHAHARIVAELPILAALKQIPDSPVATTTDS